MSTRPPLITHVSVRNYQSLAHLDLPLAPFTVIVGPSSSGKSALTRALRTLSANARGSAFVSSWAKRTVIEAEISRLAPEHPDATPENPYEPLGTVRLTRGARTEDNAYEILPPETNPNAPTSRFTKLNGEVPPEVCAFLGIDPDHPVRGTSLHFASQFDAPFLLDATPGEVARSLASLTNVHVVFEASRAARKARLAATGTLRTRQGDHKAITARVPQFRTLAQQRKALATAEERAASAQAITDQISNLDAAITRLTTAQATLTRTEPLASRTLPSLSTATTLTTSHRQVLTALTNATRASQRAHDAASRSQSPPPSLTAAQHAHTAHSAFVATLGRLKSARAAVTTTRQALDEARIAFEQAEHDYAQELAAAGTCPTCGQTTEHLHPTEEKNLV